MKKILLTIFSLILYTTTNLNGQTALTLDMPNIRTEKDETIITNPKEKRSFLSTVIFDGQIGMTYGLQSLFINFGGPGLKLKIAKKFRLGLNMASAIRFKTENELPLSQSRIGASLGIMPSFTYKRLSAIVAFYTFKVDVSDEEGNIVKNAECLKPTFGLAYRFGK
jgi:hypothetical protein